MYAIDRKITTAERYDFQRQVWQNVSFSIVVIVINVFIYNSSNVQVSITGRKAKMYFSTTTVQDQLYAIERTNGQFYRIDVEANGTKLRLVCLSGNSLLTNGQYELLSKS